MVLGARALPKVLREVLGIGRFDQAGEGDRADAFRRKFLEDGKNVLHRHVLALRDLLDARDVQ